MILVLYPCLPALGVVIMRHVEPGAEQKKRGEFRDCEGYHPIIRYVIVKRINV